MITVYMAPLAEPMYISKIMLLMLYLNVGDLLNMWSFAATPVHGVPYISVTLNIVFSIVPGHNTQ